MNKIELFCELIKHLDGQAVKDEFKYIGTGNPTANILIIGKEASIHSNEDQKRIEIDSNMADWKAITKIIEIDGDYRNKGNYTPLYPYKGQKLRIDNKHNDGTSRTWYNYQKLINLVFDNESNQDIDFHENVFITEVNSTPSLKTNDAIQDSIPFRKENILTSEFIKSFPIVLISGVGYFTINDSENEIEKIFEVKYEGPKRLAGGKESQPYWIHRNIDNKPKLLINCHQLSIGVADVLLYEIANEIIKSNMI
jgi:hypothetical protein